MLISPTAGGRSCRDRPFDWRPVRLSTHSPPAPSLNRALNSLVPLAIGLAAGGGLLAACFPAEAATTVYELAQVTHFHGLAVDAADSSRLYLATHDGPFIVEPEDGTAYPLSEIRHDLMGFTPDPRDPSILYASGHPAGGGNLGLIASGDRGRSWRQLAGGVGGPADFHQLAVSATDPRTIYGAYRGQLQVSPDGGRTWEVVGPTPEGLIDLAASSKSPVGSMRQRRLVCSKARTAGEPGRTPIGCASRRRWCTWRPAARFMRSWSAPA